MLTGFPWVEPGENRGASSGWKRKRDQFQWSDAVHSRSCLYLSERNFPCNTHYHFADHSIITKMHPNRVQMLAMLSINHKIPCSKKSQTAFLHNSAAIKTMGELWHKFLPPELNSFKRWESAVSMVRLTTERDPLRHHRNLVSGSHYILVE